MAAALSGSANELAHRNGLQAALPQPVQDRCEGVGTRPAVSARVLVSIVHEHDVAGANLREHPSSHPLRIRIDRVAAMHRPRDDV